MINKTSMTKTHGAVLYTRVSTEEQAEKGTSPDVQRDACLAMAQAAGAEVVAVCPDLGFSGTRYTSRPGIMEALRRIEAGEANLLIATKVDRLGRTARVIVDIVERVLKAGGQVLTQDYRFDGGPAGQMLLGVFAGMAGMEHAAIRERTKSGAVRRAQEGVQPQRSRSPLGLHVVTKSEKLRGLYPDAAPGTYLLTHAAPTVAGMFARYAGGQSLREVCRWLNGEGTQTQFGGAYWRPSQLKKVLVNPCYKGEATYGKHRRRTEEVGTKTVQHMDIQDTYLSVPCPAIVSPDTWAAVQARLSEGRAVYGGNPERRHLLGGLLRCPLCGRGMHGRKRERINKGKLTLEHLYACPDQRASRNPGGVVCNKEMVSGADVEAAILRGVEHLASRSELASLALAAYRQREADAFDPAEAGTVEAALRSLKARERATVEAQVAGIQAGADPAAYADAFEHIREERGRLSARLAQLQQAQGQPPRAKGEDEAALLARALADVSRVLSSQRLTDGKKHDLLARVIAGIVPEGQSETGEARYRVEMRGMNGVEKGHSVRML